MDNRGLLTSTQFGESTYGNRLSYNKPAYRDPVWAVLYIVHVIGLIAVGIYFWSSVGTDLSFLTENDASGNDSDATDVPLTGVFVALAACLIAGIVFGLCWLRIMKRFASTIIKAMLFLNVGVWLVVGIVGMVLMPEGLALAVIGFLFALIYGVWAWCVWDRVEFSSVLLSISSMIISKYEGTIIISLAVIVFNLLWMSLWGSSFAGYYLYALSKHELDEDDPESDANHVPMAIMFAFLVSFYWGLQVNKNISHTTACGVAATWYFTASVDHKPTPAAFKRTMTTSFGSVCLGSLLVAFLQALRALLRGSRRGRSFVTLIALCLLQCIESLIRYFNQYAFAHCAIYGTSFIDSAKATWNMFMTRGLTALINDDLTGMALTAGAFIGGICTAAIGFLIAMAFYRDTTFWPMVPVAVAVYGFIVGMMLTLCVLMVLASSVIALFVCYAEDPAAMFQNHREEFERLSQARDSWGSIYTTYGGARVQPVGPVIEVCVAQPVVVQTQPQQEGVVQQHPPPPQ